MPDPDLFIVKPDPADTPKQAAEKLVWSFLVLFENLVSARTLLKSVQEATLLVTPAPGQPALAKGSETTTAEAFVKKLQVLLLLTMLLLCLGQVKVNGLAEFDCWSWQNFGIDAARGGTNPSHPLGSLPNCHSKITAATMLEL